MRIEGEGDSMSLLGCKVKPLLQFNAELTNEWSYTSTPQHAFIVCTDTNLQWRKICCQQFIDGHKNSFVLRVGQVKYFESRDILPSV